MTSSDFPCRTKYGNNPLRAHRYRYHYLQDYPRICVECGAEEQPDEKGRSSHEMAMRRELKSLAGKIKNRHERSWLLRSELSRMQDSQDHIRRTLEALAPKKPEGKS